MRELIATAIMVATGLAAQSASAADRAWSMTPMTAVPVGADLRLRVLSVQSTGSSVDINDQASRLRKGFGGSMIDYFPLGLDGFHISSGGRMMSRLSSPFHDQLLYAPRGGGIRSSRRLTPAMTMGYSRQLQHGLTMGVEGGVVMGHLDNNYYSVVRPGRSNRLNDGGRGNSNPVARMTVAYSF